MEKTKNKYQTTNNSKVPILNIVVCCLFVFCCLLFVVSTATVASADPTGRFLPFYWIKGQVKTHDGSLLAEKLQGRDIYLHGLSFAENEVIKVKVDAEGYFRVNAGQLYYWHSNNVYYDENNKLPVFLLSIVKKDDAQWGAFAVVQPDYNKGGYVIADLTLAPNGGPKVGKGMAVGIVQSAIGPLGQIPISLPDPYGLKKSDDNGAAIWFEVNEDPAYIMTCDPVGFTNVPPSTPKQACPVTADHITIVKYQLEGTLISGSVDISIVKVDTNADGIVDGIKLSWDPKVNPGETMVYMIMTGDGTGVFNNSLLKAKVYDQNSQEQFDITADKGNWQVFIEGAKNPAEVLNIETTGGLPNGEAILKNQVNGIIGKDAQGNNYNYFPEMYFRFIKIQGQGAPDLTNPALLQAFAGAKAVGKVDMTIAGGKKWTYFSSPFLDAPEDLNLLLANQLNYTAGAEPAASVRVYSHDAGGWNKAVYFNGTNWVPVPGLQPAVNNNAKGLYVLTRPADTDKILTLLGKVKPLDTQTDYVIKPKWNVIGLPYPVQMDINNVVLNVGAKNDVPALADKAYGHVNNGFNACSYLKADGTWAPVPGLQGVTLKAGKPIYYQSKSAGDKNWSIKPSALGY